MKLLHALLTSLAAVSLLAGQAMRLAGERQRAREMLASVRPEDPSFAAARELLRDPRWTAGLAVAGAAAIRPKPKGMMRRMAMSPVLCGAHRSARRSRRP